MRTLENIRRFRLSDTFVEPYKDAEVPWGPIGYITYKRTYSRRLSEFDPDAERRSHQQSGYDDDDEGHGHGPGVSCATQ